ncbi:MAG: bacillithiol biosynthesis cysteine-adding enzyme BshC [Flavobacteriales bacterium]|nr:bacillithiol biosynthesis cysteine-adding enzyme BshC [Flavobacteriales bacterium]
METDCIDFKDTGYFSKIILDYLAGNEALAPFYSYSPELDSFAEVIQKKHFSDENRQVLHASLLNQYERDGIKLKRVETVATNIQALAKSNTYTVTTGHQLSLFTGPLYFIYKIVSAIKLARTLTKKHPDQNFVPVYWMATEDHDFVEVNHFNFQGKRYEWNSEQKGAVGRMKTEGLASVFEVFRTELTDYSSNAEELKNLFEKAYLKHDNLAAATRFLVNELFAEYGLVIIDGDDVSLKTIFAPIVKKELLTEFSSQHVAEQSAQLEKRYKIQVNPREINLFYLSEGDRNRIVKEKGAYFVNDTSISFTEAEILEELEKHPENFSPNVLLRPVYQEAILPNLAYIGGGGELAYWFQLKSTFEAVEIPLPMMILRNSVMWMDAKQSKAFDKLDIKLQQLFLDEGVLTKKWVKQHSDHDLSLAEESKMNQQFFTELLQKAESIDVTLKAHVEAVQTKQQRALTNLSEKLIRAERRQQKEATDRIAFLKDTLFKNRGLQERQANFSEVYLREGKGMIDDLLEEFEVPTQEFLLVR